MKVIESDAGMGIEVGLGMPPRPEAPVPPLPEDPLVSIRPSRGWVGINVRDFWAYRELFWFLVWRDLKVKYKQTAFGVAWVVIQPVCMMVVFTLFFGRLAGLPSDGAPYPIFVLAGLVPWTFVSTAVANASNSLIGNSTLITKVYCPRLLIPAATVGAGLVDLAISSVLLLGMMAVYHVAPSWRLLTLPLLVAWLAALSWGVGTFLAALNVKFRDVRYVLPFLTQVWMFTSPIIYPAGMVPARWRPLAALNPLVGLIEGFRAAVLGRAVDWTAVGIAAAVTTCLTAAGLLVFRSMERSFADQI